MNLTAKRLRKVLDYNPETGKFVRRIARSNQRAGTETGCINTLGYVVIMVDYKLYLAHRLAWLYVYGSRRRWCGPGWRQNAVRWKFERQWLTDEIVGSKPWVCTLRCAYRIWPDAPAHNNQTLRYWLKPEGLDQAIAHAAHRANADAYVTAHILNLMFRHPKVELKGLIACSARPALLPTVPFGKHFGKKWADVDRDYIEWVSRQSDMSEDVLYTASQTLKGPRP